MPPDAAGGQHPFYRPRKEPKQYDRDDSRHNIPYGFFLYAEQDIVPPQAESGYRKANEGVMNIPVRKPLSAAGDKGGYQYSGVRRRYEGADDYLAFVF